MDTRETRLITTSFGLSLLLHATVLVPVFTVALSSASSGETASRLEADAISPLPVAPPEPPEPKDPTRPDEPEPTPEDPPKPDDREVQLGIDDGVANSMNWIGYSEYQEHLAALAETDQAARRMTDTGGEGGAAPEVTGLPPSPDTAPPSQAVAAATPTPPVPPAEPALPPEPQPATPPVETIARPAEPEPQPQPEPKPEPKPEAEQTNRASGLRGSHKMSRGKIMAPRV